MYFIYGNKIYIIHVILSAWDSASSIGLSWSNAMPYFSVFAFEHFVLFSIYQFSFYLNKLSNVHRDRTAIEATYKPHNVITYVISYIDLTNYVRAITKNKCFQCFMLHTGSKARVSEIWVCVCVYYELCSRLLCWFVSHNARHCMTTK